MNPDGRWTAPTPTAAQPQPIAAPYQPQYPGDSSYLPLPDFGGHPAMRPTLPPADHKHLRLVAALVTVSVLMVAVGATFLILHMNGVASRGVTSAQQTAITSSASKADSERRHELKTIQVQIEAFFVKTGRYPLLAELNSPSWVTANMSGLAQQENTITKTAPLVFVAKPSTKQYAYQVYADAKDTDCTAQPARCIVYVLTAKLSNGSSYVLRSATA